MQLTAFLVVVAVIAPAIAYGQEGATVLDHVDRNIVIVYTGSVGVDARKFPAAVRVPEILTGVQGQESRKRVPNTMDE